MVAVSTLSWEEISAPDFGNPARAAWREAVQEVAEKAKATLPECNGRVDSAVKIVLAWIPTNLKVAKFLGNRGLKVQK